MSNKEEAVRWLNQGERDLGAAHVLMDKICRIDISRSEELPGKIKSFVEKLTSRINIKKVYLFGSVARNDLNEGSDIDLAIIGDFKERFIDQNIDHRFSS
ncbi:MAG: nucleotidyltransferase domain-containing protein [Candidatus Methanoperedens sp.]|nr:nucleotidyltransferase domain-containing protein [Candidatus Methanoperedens sp.]MCE8427122.1 nucleotidyltransferase domain-containing protein [Candidatus Methanoperedens sp.]